MISLGVVEALANAMLDKMERLKSLLQDTIRSHRRRLFGGNPSPLRIISELPVHDLSEIGFNEAAMVRDALEQQYKDMELCTKIGKMASTRKFFAYCMQNKLMQEDLDVLKLFPQSGRKYSIPKTLTNQQRQILRTEKFSDDPFLDLRGTVIYVVLGEANAVREEVEMERTSIDDVHDGWDGMVIVITGKKHAQRPIRLAFSDAEVVRRYIAARAEILAEYGVTNEKSLFIKLCPEYDTENGELTFGMSRSGIYQVFARFRDGHPELADVKPYHLRKDAVSRMLVVGRALGIPLEEIAIRNGQSINVAYFHYNGLFDLYTECLRLTPKEVVPFLKALWAHCMMEFRKNPHGIEHLACARAIMDALGRLQFILLMQAITAGRIRVFPVLKSEIDARETKLLDELKAPLRPFGLDRLADETGDEGELLAPVV